MKIRVHYMDGTTADAVVGSREQVSMERKYDINYAAVFNEDKGRVEYVYYLCWSALSNHGEVTAEFDEWLGTVRDAEPIADVEPRPTKRGRRPASSSS